MLFWIATFWFACVVVILWDIYLDRNRTYPIDATVIMLAIIFSPYMIVALTYVWIKYKIVDYLLSKKIDKLTRELSELQKNDAADADKEKNDSK